MEAIKSYLNNMFANLPQTAEVLKAREELLQMMEDKYSELRSEDKTENEAVGSVISEFGNLEELGPQLGIANQVTASMDPDNKIAMDSSQVNQYLSDIREASSKIGIAVAFCILSALPLILLHGLIRQLGIKEEVANAIGIGILLLAVGIAVYNFIINGLKTEKYEELEKRPVSISNAVAAMIRREQEAFRPKFARKIASGVLMIILGAGIVSITGVLSNDNSPLIFGAVAVLLVLVSIAVYGFITAGMEEEVYEKLLNTGDYSPSRKKSNQAMEKFGGIYWTMVVLGYLAWSFITKNWDYSWIVWPIAGLLYGLISAVVGAFLPKD
ncbi:MAG: permease prefix domain 1-containing protein [Anaerolineaceae bacterium]|nr:permease prefix domain 1-containing protein [Anaerolineaceae bacterium]